MPITAKPIAVASAVTVSAPRSEYFSAALVTKGRTVNRVSEGTAPMIPIHHASMPTAFSQTVKNGRWVPIIPKVAP